MNSVFIIVLGLIVYYLGLRVYAKHIDRKVIHVDPRRTTPACMYADGVDFMPTSRNILFGYQFKSIAGAAPVLGPIIAIKWGWLPGLLWILLGTFLIGWVQDYSSAIVSMRNDGKTFGGISYSLISPRARTILLTFIYFYLLLVAAAFANVVATFMANTPTTPLPIILLAFSGILVGHLIYKGRMSLLLVTVIGLAIFYGAVVGGNWVPLALGDPAANKTLWLVFALAFSFFGSVLPIWSFVQPINYLGFYIIFFGMAAAVLGIFVGHPSLRAPAVTSYVVAGLPIWPMLFVTIACGAISGWHSIVSSTGTSRQLESELDVRPVAAGAMFLEMILALIALTIASVAVQGGAWHAVFGAGLSDVFHYLGLPYGWGRAYGPVMIIVLAITILHLVIRFMRIATNELVGRRVPLLRNPYIGTIIALILAFLLVKTGTFTYIWVLFGSANQLMAGLALFIASIWLVSQKKNPTYAVYPMIFMYVTTLAALSLTAYQVLKQAITRVDLTGRALSGSVIVGNWFAGIIGIVLFIAALFLAYDGIRAYVRYKNETSPQRGG